MPDASPQPENTPARRRRSLEERSNAEADALRAEIEATDAVIRGLVDENNRLKTELRLRDDGEPFKPHALRRLRDENKQLRARVAELEGAAS